MAKTKKMAERVIVNSRGKINLRMPSVNVGLVKGSMLLIALVGSAYILLQGAGLWKNVWPVKELILQGNVRYLPEATIREFVNQQAVKGMLAIDLEELQNGAEKIDWIDSVEVRKVWPQKLIFLVQEHLPVARVNQYILTQKGTLINAETTSEDITSLPFITTQLSENDSSENYRRVWQEFRNVKRQFELLSLEVISLRVDKINNWHLKFAKGLTMKLGRKNRIERVRRIVGVYANIQDKSRIKSIDLRYHNGLSVEWLDNEETESKG